jgi:hypothetical protein
MLHSLAQVLNAKQVDEARDRALPPAASGPESIGDELYALTALRRATDGKVRLWRFNSVLRYHIVIPKLQLSPQCHPEARIKKSSTAPISRFLLTSNSLRRRDSSKALGQKAELPDTTNDEGRVEDCVHLADLSTLAYD